MHLAKLSSRYQNWLTEQLELNRFNITAKLRLKTTLHSIKKRVQHQTTDHYCLD